MNTDRLFFEEINTKVFQCAGEIVQRARATGHFTSDGAWQEAVTLIRNLLIEVAPELYKDVYTRRSVKHFYQTGSLSTCILSVEAQANEWLQGHTTAKITRVSSCTMTQGWGFAHIITFLIEEEEGEEDEGTGGDNHDILNPFDDDDDSYHASAMSL